MNVLQQILAWLVAHGAIITALMGLVVPVIVGALANCNWGAWPKRLAAIGLSLAFSIVSAAIAGQVDLVNLGATGMVILAISQTFYTMVLKPAGLDDWMLEHLGNVTLPSGAED